MTVAQVVNILYSLVDRMYIGHIPGVGHISLTGMGLTLPLISIVLAFANLGGMGGKPPVLHLPGQRGGGAGQRRHGQHPVPAVVLWICHPSGDHPLFGPHSHLRAEPGSKGSRHRHHHRPGLFGGVGAELPHREEIAASLASVPPAPPMGPPAAHYHAGAVRLLHQHHQLPGADCVQQGAAHLRRRPVRGGHDHHQLSAIGC